MTTSKGLILLHDFSACTDRPSAGHTFHGFLRLIFLPIRDGAGWLLLGQGSLLGWFPYMHKHRLPPPCAPLHLTPASSLCAQSCKPGGLETHWARFVSVPTQFTWSSRILPIPWPNVASFTATAPSLKLINSIRKSKLVNTSKFIKETMFLCKNTPRI